MLDRVRSPLCLSAPFLSSHLLRIECTRNRTLRARLCAFSSLFSRCGRNQSMRFGDLMNENQWAISIRSQAICGYQRIPVSNRNPVAADDGKKSNNLRIYLCVLSFRWLALHSRRELDISAWETIVKLVIWMSWPVALGEKGGKRFYALRNINNHNNAQSRVSDFTIKSWFVCVLLVARRVTASAAAERGMCAARICIRFEHETLFTYHFVCFFSICSALAACSIGSARAGVGDEPSGINDSSVTAQIMHETVHGGGIEHNSRLDALIFLFCSGIPLSVIFTHKRLKFNMFLLVFSPLVPTSKCVSRTAFSYSKQNKNTILFRAEGGKMFTNFFGKRARGNKGHLIRMWWELQSNHI